MANFKAENSKVVAYIEKCLGGAKTSSEPVWIKKDEFRSATGLAPSKVMRRPALQQALKDRDISARLMGSVIFMKRLDPNAPNAQPQQVAPPPKSAKVDPDYYWMPPRATKLLSTTFDSGQNALLVGPAGTGKSTLLRKIFEARKQEYLMINLNGEVSVDDLVGVKDLIVDPTTGSTVTTFNPGVLTMAMREGKALIIDELDAATPDVLFVMQGILEGQPLVLTKCGSEIVIPTDGFIVGATANTIGKGDDTGMYAGTNVLNEAFLDRFGVVMRTWYMPEKEEKTVLAKRVGLHAKIADRIVQIAVAARAAMREGSLFSTFSTRKCLAMARLMVKGVEITDAFRVTCLSKVVSDDAKLLCEIAQRILGVSINPDEDFNS
jgi:cobaltochelatase CobS